MESWLITFSLPAAVPTFVYDDAVARGHGADIQIVVTQPRRVSAIGGQLLATCFFADARTR